MTENKDLEELLKRPERQNHSELIKELEKLNDPYDNAFLSREELNEVCKPLIEFYNQTYTNYKIKNLVSKGKIVDTYSIFNNILSTKTHILNLMNEDLFQRICNEILRTTTPFNLVSDNAIGPFVTSLINNTNHNDIKIESNSIHSNFGNKLKNKNLEINFALEGDSFSFIENCNIKINGNITNRTGNTFYDIKNSNIIMNGNITGKDIANKLINGNNLIFNGLVNSSTLGRDMSGGKIIINSNANCDLSYINGGYIEINGDIYGRIGDHMTNGTIIIKGRKLGCLGIGYNMKGGNIHIYGDVDFSETAENMSGGYIHIEGIFHKGSIGMGMKGGNIKINRYKNVNLYNEKYIDLGIKI